MIVIVQPGRLPAESPACTGAGLVCRAAASRATYLYHKPRRPRWSRPLIEPLARHVQHRFALAGLRAEHHHDTLEDAAGDDALWLDHVGREQRITRSWHRCCRRVVRLAAAHRSGSIGSGLTASSAPRTVSSRMACTRACSAIRRSRALTSRSMIRRTVRSRLHAAASPANSLLTTPAKLSIISS